MILHNADALKLKKMWIRETNENKACTIIVLSTNNMMNVFTAVTLHC